MVFLEVMVLQEDYVELIVLLENYVEVMVLQENYVVPFRGPRQIPLHTLINKLDKNIYFKLKK